MVREMGWPLYSIWGASERNGFISQSCGKKHATMAVIMWSLLLDKRVTWSILWVNLGVIHLEGDVSVIAEFRAL